MSAPPDYPARIAALSEQLRAAQADLYLQSMGDEFQSEYAPLYATRLPYLTGFTGSAGLGVFWADTKRKPVLFTDGRYTIQAKEELKESGVTPLNSGDVTLSAWLALEKAQGLRIGFDPWLITHAQLSNWEKTAASLKLEWVALNENPVDAIWSDQAEPPQGEVVLHAETLAGKSYHAKREAVLEIVQAQKADGAILTLPDGINWLLNIRGSDIPFNPLLLSYFILQKDGNGSLYCYERTFSQDVLSYLKENKVSVKKLEDIVTGKGVFKPGSYLIDPTVSAEGFWHLAQQQKWKLIEADDPTLLPKACKNPVELDGIRAAHQRDGAALSKFLAWFDGQVSGGRMQDELGVANMLEEFRRADNRYRGPSFATIAGSGPHGAIVHYHASEQSNRRVLKGDLLLLDSGGQYEDGTTDVTRTIAVGGASPQMAEHFTRVLKGHIALASAKFPEGTGGGQLDALARQYLWQAGLDYDHGTGHGVGAYLCVHEGPQRISKKGSSVALQPGMVISNEPGYYAAGQYGIRIESLVTVVEVGMTADGKKLLGFETLTLAPIDTRLVMVALLSNEERNWLNDYHRRVARALEKLMDAREKAWLSQATRAI